MPSREDLTPRQVIDIVSGEDPAPRNDLLRQAIEEAAGAHLRLFKDEAESAQLFPADEFSRFEERLGYVFPREDAWLACAALTTKAFGYESVGQFLGAQPLAWLGDAKICDVLSEALIAAFPTAGRGELAVARSARVMRKTLACAATELRIDEFLLLGKSYVASFRAGGPRPVPSRDMLGEAFEAVLGAVAVSGGIEAVRRCYFRVAPLPTTLAKLRQETAEMMAPDGEGN